MFVFVLFCQKETGSTLFKILLADAYIIQIQKYEVHPPVLPSTPMPMTTKSAIASPDLSKALSPSAAHVVRLPISSAQFSSPLSISKTLLAGGLSVRPKLTVSQPNNLVKATSPKGLTQIPIQVSGQLKNQHITLAALNQLTAGKLSGTNLTANVTKTIQIVSPSKSGQIVRPQLQGANLNLVTNISSQSSQVSTSADMKNASLKSLSSSPAATQYALVRAQLPSSSGGPAQTVTFIRAIAPNSTSATSAGTTVSVTPQQMAALLKGQQGQSQIQKVLSAATGGNQVRAPTVLNGVGVAHTISQPTISVSVTQSPSKLISLQFPQKTASIPLKSINVSSFLSTSKATVTTQSSNISPMGTLVSGIGISKNLSSILNQCPSVKPQLPSALSNLAINSTTNKLQVTSSSPITTDSTVILETEKVACSDQENFTHLNNIKQAESLEVASVASSNSCVTTGYDKELINSGVLLIDTAILDSNLSNSSSLDEDKTIENVVSSSLKLESESTYKEETQTDLKSALILETPKIEEKELIDDIKEELHKLSPNMSENLTDVSMLEEKPEIKDELMETDPSIESVAATTLAQLASYAGNINSIQNASAADMPNDPLSTLAALATSSPIATGPLLHIGNGQNADGITVSPVLVPAGKKVYLIVKTTF